MSTKRLMDLAIVALSVAAIGALGSALRRRVKAAEAAQEPSVRMVPDWRFYVSGHQVSIGKSNAREVIVEFGDFECPYCARFSHVLDTVAAREAEGITLYFRHFPLPAHPYAHAAAIASECAAEQGRFAEFYHLAYGGTEPLSVALAGEATLLPDPSAYRACVESRAVNERIAVDSLAAVRLGVTGTPGVLVGDTFIAGSPSATLLDSALRAQNWR